MRHINSLLLAVCLLCAGVGGIAVADCICPNYPCNDCQCSGSTGGKCPGGTCPSGKCYVAGASVGDFTTPAGKEAACPLPKELHLRNRGGSDGSGLCVFCSIQHSAQWASVPELEDLFRWMWDKPGGGYPDKVDKMIARKCKELNKPVPSYVQIEGNDLAPLRLACKTGRMPAITYGWSPTGRYGGQRIPHMVSLVHADNDWFGILDNNYPGSVEWMSEKEFLKSYSAMGPGWCVILLEPGPPPPPYTLPERKEREYQGVVYGGCPGGSCGRSVTPFTPLAVPHVPAPTPEPEYRWVDTSDANQIALYRGDVQLGNWRLREGGFFTLVGDTFTPGKCPHTPPAQAQARQQKPEAGPFGVVSEEIREGHYTIKGREASRKQVMDLIGGNLVDDSALMWVTISGPRDLRGPVLADLSGPTFAQWRGRIKVKSYDADHWAVKDAGFPSGAPSIHIESSDGASLWRQPNYEHGAAGLLAALEWAERKTRPDYDPTKDPGPQGPWRKPDPPPPPAPAPNTPAPTPEPVSGGVSIPPGAMGGTLGGLLVALLALFVARKPSNVS